MGSNMLYVPGLGEYKQQGSGVHQDAVGENFTATVTTDTTAQGWTVATGVGTLGQDNTITFPNQVRKVVLYNGSSQSVPFEFDGVSTAASFPLLPGQSMVLEGILCTTIHVFPSVTLPINAAGGLYLRGWQ